MNMKSFLLFRTAGLLSAACLVTAARAAQPPADDVKIEGDNLIKVSAQATDFSGHRASSQARTQVFRNLSGGIEELSIGRELDKTTTLQIDGRALPGAEDYLAQFRLTRTEVGSFEAGYKRFRTFYDGAGGFFPLNNAWLPIHPRALFVDRGRFFATATVALPKQPVFTFRYTNETRSGRKDSTIWGDTDFTGVPIYSLSSLNPVSANRKIIPAYLQLGERHESWEASVRHLIGTTRVFLSVGGGRIDNLNTRSIDRYPGELRPFPAIAANPPVLVPPWLANNENQGFDQQGLEQDRLTLMGKVEKPLGDSLKLFAEASRFTTDGDIVASRLISAKLQTPVGVKNEIGLFTPGGRPPYSYTSTGAVESTVLTGVAGVEATPAPGLRLSAAVKAEDYSSRGKATANYISTMVVQATGVTTPVPLTGQHESSIDEKVWVPELEVRYTGFRNCTFYGSWDYRRAPGDEYLRYGGITTSSGGPVVLASPVIATDRVKERHHNALAGTTWNATRVLTFRAEVFTKDHENRFTGTGANLGGYYVLDYDIRGARVTAEVKPAPGLSFKTRYVHQRGKAAIASDGYLEGDSNDSKRHQIAETIDWNPGKSLYVQANVNVVFDKTSTAYPRAGGSANDVLRNADNNYWNGSLITGFAVDKVTDAQLTVTYYKADNYNPAILASDPLGAGARDVAAYLGLKRKFSPKLLGHARAGYLDSRNETTGGNTNFRGPLGYLAIEYGL